APARSVGLRCRGPVRRALRARSRPVARRARGGHALGEGRVRPAARGRGGNVKPFDLLDSPLHDGICLIEASAGTGKTYTIAGLVLRLVVERDVPIGRILVVTFTNAATDELKTRIRASLEKAWRTCRSEVA